VGRRKVEDEDNEWAVSTRSPKQFLRGQKGVHGSGTEASRSRVTNLAQRFENTGELRSHCGIDSPRAILRVRFSMTNNLSMMPDAELVETQGANLRLSPFSTMARASRVTGRPYSMREERQAEAGLVPDFASGRTRQSADIVFGESASSSGATTW